MNVNERGGEKYAERIFSRNGGHGCPSTRHGLGRLEKAGRKVGRYMVLITG